MRTRCPDLPADLEAVVHRCLDKSPGERFADAAALERALAACGCANQWTEEQTADWWSAESRRDRAADNGHQTEPAFLTPEAPPTRTS